SIKEASRYFVEVASTPPRRGGENCGPLRFSNSPLARGYVLNRGGTHQPASAHSSTVADLFSYSAKFRGSHGGRHHTGVKISRSDPFPSARHTAVHRRGPSPRAALHQKYRCRSCMKAGSGRDASANRNLVMSVPDYRAAHAAGMSAGRLILPLQDRARELHP